MESDAKPLAGGAIDAARILVREPACGDTVIRHHVDTPNVPDGFQRTPNFLLYEVSAALVHPSPTTRQYVAPPLAHGLGLVEGLPKLEVLLVAP